MFSSSDLVYGPTAAQVARTMVSNGAYRVDKDNFFTWKSGIKAPVYTDCRAMMAAPGGSALIKSAMASAIRSNWGTPDLVIGVAESGIYWSAKVQDELGVQHAFVRKAPKAHGIAGLLVGLDPEDDLSPKRAVIVEDLVASGGSLVKAIDAIRAESRIEIAGAMSIVNWDFFATRDRFRELRVETKALVSYPQLLEAALDAKLIDEPFLEELLRFYRDPRGHVWAKPGQHQVRADGAAL